MPHSSRDYYWILFLLGSVAFTGAMLYLFHSTALVGTGDAASYVCAAQSITENGFFPGDWYGSGFGFSLLIAFVHTLGLDWNWSAKLLSLLFGIINLVLVGNTLALFFNDKRAYAFTLPLFFTYEYMEHTLFGYVGGVSLFFLYASLNVFLRAQKSFKHAGKNVWVSSILFSFTAWVRISNVAFAPFFLSTKKYNWKWAILPVLSAILFFYLSHHNARDDTSLKYLAWGDYLHALIPNIFAYTFALAQNIPFILPFLPFIPLALGKEKYHAWVWWVIPYVLLVLFFPLGQNLYYLFPILPFLLVGGFLGLEWALHTLIQNKKTVSRVLVLALVLQLAWLIPNFSLVHATTAHYVSLERGAEFIEMHSSIPLFITGREGESYSARWNNTPSCGGREIPDMLVYPYTVTHLFNQKDTRPHREAELKRLADALAQKRVIYISSEALWFEQKGWCPELNCIPLPHENLERVFHHGTYAIYAHRYA